MNVALRDYDPNEPRDPHGMWTGQTATPEFKAWFGKSKVVDESGKPLVVYHATGADILSFKTDVNELGAHFGTQSQANQIAKGRPYTPQIYPVFLRIENPLRLKDTGRFDTPAVAPQLEKLGILGKGGAEEMYRLWTKGGDAAAKALHAVIKKAGYDGVVYRNEREGTPEKDEDSYIAFHANQIKSAIGNKGTFSRRSDRITDASPDQDDIRDGLDRELTRRWTKTAREVKRSILAHDALGIGDKAPQVAQPTDDKAEMFRRWLNERLAVGIGGYDGSWLEPFVNQASERGAGAAMMDAGPDDEPRDEAGRWTSESSYPPINDDPDGMMRNYAAHWDFVPIKWLERMRGNTLRQDTTDLARDIQANGVREPLIINVGKASRTAVLGEGNHRLDALKSRGYTHAPVRVIVGNEYGKRNGIKLDDDLIPRAGEYFKADARPSEVFRSLAGASQRLTDAAQANLAFLLPSGPAPSSKACHGATVAHLAGICGDVSQRAHDSVADGLLTRRRPSQIARLVDHAMGHGLKRSRALAEHAVTQAYSQATLDAMEARGVTHVGTVSERKRLYDFDPDEPRDEAGKWTSSGFVSTLANPAFRAWFEGSKVVDESGNPIVAFHGSTKDFDVFHGKPPMPLGEKGKIARSTWFGPLGNWFAAPVPQGGGGNYEEGNAEEVAGLFTLNEYGEHKSGAQIYPVYLSIKNPEEYESIEELRDASFGAGGAHKLRKRLIAKGRDGLVVRWSDSDGNVYRDDWVAFSQHQVKSAIGNKGTFDPKSPRLIDAEDDEVIVERPDGTLVRVVRYGDGWAVVAMDAPRKNPQPKHPRSGRFAKAHVVAREMRRSKRTGRFRKQGVSAEEQRKEELAEARFGRVRGKLDVLTAGDDRVCDVCDDISANGPYTISKARSLIPAHPNAVLSGSTIASYGSMHEMVASAFAGAAIDIRTTAKTTTIGPNHPMLTRRGFVKACDLKEGDELLYDRRANRLPSASGGRPDFEEMPLVEDCFRSLVSICGSMSVAAASHDFHGDVGSCYGEIKVVKPKRNLLPVFDPCGIEQLRELDLSLADMELKAITRFGSGGLDRDAILLPASSGLSAKDAFVWLPVLAVHERQFSGHAFDASTASSLYCSDGFVVSNCRCVFVAAGSMKDALLDYDPSEPRDPLGMWTKTEGFVAYHGSGHEFSQFGIEHVGEGQGTQVYGHGLYLAEEPKVAESYKKEGLPTDMDGLRFPDGKILFETDMPDEQSVALQMIKPSGTVQGGIDLTQKLLTERPDKNWTAIRQRSLAILQGWKAQGAEPSIATGNLYQVKVHATPDEFLDWDKPLSQQSKLVQDYVKNRDLGASFKKRAESATPPVQYDPSGEQMMRGFIGMGPKGAASLREAGIKGVRYLDAGSRLFGDAEKYVENFGTRAKAEAYARDRYMKASLGDIVYWGGIVSQLEKPETHNYVIVEPAILEITHHNGKPLTPAEARDAMITLWDFDPDEPRDERGRWTSSGSVIPSSVHAGGEEFVSPSVETGLSFEGAKAALSGQRQAAMLKVSDEIDGALGLKETAKSVIGAWADGAENSVLATLPQASWDEIRLSAAMKGYVGDQKAVLAFKQDDNGDAFMYEMHAHGALDDIHHRLLNDGLAFHTLAPTVDGADVYVADLDGSATEAIQRAAKDFHANATYQRGRAEFIGTQLEEGTDRAIRDDARRNYEGVIQQSTVSGGADVWQRNRDRWSQALTGVRAKELVGKETDDLDEGPASEATLAAQRAWGDEVRQRAETQFDQDGYPKRHLEVHQWPKANVLAGANYNTLAQYNPNTGRIQVFADALPRTAETGSANTVEGTVAHEIQHAKTDWWFKMNPSIERKMKDGLNLRHTKGGVEMPDLMDKPLDIGRATPRDLMKNDGVTPYSTHTWNAWLDSQIGGSHPLPFDLPFGETISDMRAVERETGKLPGDPKWQAIYHDIEAEWQLAHAKNLNERLRA